MKKKCEGCGKDFEVNKYQVRTKKYCTDTCGDKFRKTTAFKKKALTPEDVRAVRISTPRS